MKQPPKKVSGGLRYSAAVLADFAKSGLTVDNLRKMGAIEYGPLQNPELPWLKHTSVGIRYHDIDGVPTGFTRYRVFVEPGTPEKDAPSKYLQGKDTGVALYFSKLLPGGWRKVIADPAVPVLVTEGEKKADAGCLLGIPTIAVGGVDSWGSDGRLLSEWEQFLSPERSFVIAYDSDGVYKRAVGTGAERLAAELRLGGADVRIAFLPPHGDAKVGLDDFIQQDPSTAKERVHQVLRAAKRHVLPELRLNDELAMVLHGSRALVLHERRLSDGRLQVTLCRPQDLAPLYKNQFVQLPVRADKDAEDKKKRQTKSVPIFEAWQQSPMRRQFDRLVFAPEGCAPDEYNLWQGFSVEPRPGDCSLFLRFLREDICNGNEEHYVYLLKWLAVMFQRPGELPRVAVVLRGRQGAGKSTLADIIGALIAAHYVTVVATEQLVGKFNGHTEGAVFLFADEAVFPGDKRSEGVLKTLITDTKRNIERKGIDIVSVRNCAHVMFATNHDWAVAADRDDRRLFVLDVSDAHADDRPYFARLRAAMDERGKAALLHFLLNYPADDFFELKPPKTLGLLEQKLRSLGPREKFWLDCLARGSVSPDGGGWLTVIPTSVVFEAWARARLMVGDRHSAETELGIALTQFVPGLVNKRISVGSRQQPHYVLPDLEECRAAFARRFGDWVTWADFAQVLGLSEVVGEASTEGSRPSRPTSKVQKGKGKTKAQAVAGKGSTASVGRQGRLGPHAPAYRRKY